MVFDFSGVKAELSSRGQDPATTVRDNFAIARHHQQEKVETTHCSENDKESPGIKAENSRYSER